MEITKLIEAIGELPRIPTEIGVKPGRIVIDREDGTFNTKLTQTDLTTLASLASDALRYEKMVDKVGRVQTCDGQTIKPIHVNDGVYWINSKYDDHYATPLEAFESLNKTEVLDEE